MSDFTDATDAALAAERDAAADHVAAALTAAQSSEAAYTALLTDYDAFVAAHPAPMIFGDSYAASAAVYAAETASFGYRMSFRYKVADLATVPADQQAVLSVPVGTSPAAIEAACARWESTHAGLLYLSNQQEPEDQLAGGTFTQAQYLATAGDINAAAARHPRVIPTWHWEAISVPDDGSAGPLEQMWQAASPDQRPRHLSFSCYALVGANGKPKADPVKQPTKVAAYATSKGCTWGVGAVGYPLSKADVANTALQQQRQTWVTTHAATSRMRGSRCWLWFNSGAYRLGNDPHLVAAISTTMK